MFGTGDLKVQVCNSSLSQGIKRYFKDSLEDEVVQEDLDKPEQQKENSQEQSEMKRWISIIIASSLIISTDNRLERERENQRIKAGIPKYFEIDISKKNTYILRLTPKAETFSIENKELVSEQTLSLFSTNIATAFKEFGEKQTEANPTNTKLHQSTKVNDGFSEEPVQFETCEVCEEKLPATRFLDLNGCGHRFCDDCLMATISHQIKNNKVLEIACLSSECKALSKPDLIIQLLSSHQDYVLEAKYKRFRNNHLALKLNKKMCPNQECWAILEEINQGEYGSCNVCKINVCLKCNHLLHPGQQCIQRNQSKTEDKITIKKCPKCRVSIYKDRGCNHMICVVCKHQFCWICNKDYSHNHYSKFNPFGCPGLQFSEVSLCNYSCRKLNAALFWVFFFLFFPLIYILFLLCLPVYIYLQRLKSDQETSIKKGIRYEPPSSCKKTTIVLFLGILGIPFMAIALALTGIIIPFIPCGIVCKLCGACSKRKAKNK